MSIPLLGRKQFPIPLDGFARMERALQFVGPRRNGKRLVREWRERRAVRASGLVDEDWYRREYPEVAEAGGDPVRDFLAPDHRRIRLPNPDFVPAEYEAANFDVRASGVSSVLHFVKHGIREGRPVSTLAPPEKPFPAGAVELRQEFPQAPALYRRTAVFASFSGDGRIGETALFYLRGLKEVVDNIVFVANHPVFPEEVAKLRELVRIAVFRHHGCYDFGSYKIGWNEAEALGLLGPDVCDELVVCNDSCYGPVFPFSESFAEMERRNREADSEDRFDFWGMTAHELFGRPHIQSYFYVFGKAVLEGGALRRFFDGLGEYRDRGRVVYFCETRLSEALTEAGHRFDSLVPGDFSKRRSAPPVKFPVSMLSRYRMPLLKAKTLAGESKESLRETEGIVRRENPALATILPAVPERTAFERPLARSLAESLAADRAARAGHAASLSAKHAALMAAHAAGRPIRILFLVTSADPFVGETQLRSCRDSPEFRAVAAVVPDLRRKPLGEALAGMRELRAALLERFDPKSFVRAEPDETGTWNDLASQADVVCYDTAEGVSDFHYNPHYALGRPFLPVLLFDRRTAGPYPLEKEFARQNYAYFWNIFFTDRDAFDIYKRHSLRKGENAELVSGGDLALPNLSDLFKGP